MSGSVVLLLCFAHTHTHTFTQTYIVDNFTTQTKMFIRVAMKNRTEVSEQKDYEQCHEVGDPLHTEPNVKEQDGHILCIHVFGSNQQ